ncbi:hypothetical protein AGABI2DRAFT_194032 [Agaricus bisporus var. bisporus H97]|nr:hypothetical protein AGABI2DRAFT_194032 [Agaricus bisporus var. bisporus H97]EKV46171.1 hypothetical protein AGABI2DRAFT_194032 [Agaricus bisporus var. bisporus H97]
MMRRPLDRNRLKTEPNKKQQNLYKTLKMRTTALVVAIIAGLIPSAIAAPAEAMTSSIVAQLGADLTVNNYYGSPRPPWKSGSKPGWYYGTHPEKHPDVPHLTPDKCKLLGHYPKAIHCPHTYPPSPHHHKPPPPPPHHYSHPPPHHSPPPPPPYHSPPPQTTPTITIVTTSTTEQPAESTDTVPPYTTPTIPPYTPTIPTYTTPDPTYGPPSPPPPPPTSSGEYYQTFYDITAAVQADDYMTYGLVDTVEDCLTMCDSVKGCGFVNTYHDVNGKDGSLQLSCALFTLCHGAEDADNIGGQSQPDGSINFIEDSNGWCKLTSY